MYGHRSKSDSTLPRTGIFINTKRTLLQRVEKINLWLSYFESTLEIQIRLDSIFGQYSWVRTQSHWWEYAEPTLPPCGTMWKYMLRLHKLFMSHCMWENLDTLITTVCAMSLVCCGLTVCYWWHICGVFCCFSWLQPWGHARMHRNQEVEDSSHPSDLTREDVTLTGQT